MDPLSDVLAILKPESYLTAGLDAGGEWAIRFGARPGTIKCHAVTAGACWLAMDGVDGAARLTAGDCIILPSGRSFTLASDLRLDPAQSHDVLGQARPGEVIVHRGGGDFAFAGVRFEVDGHKAGTLLRTLPPLIHLHEAELLQAFRLHLARQAGDRVGLLYALAEPHLGRAVEAMHGDPAHRWTLAELASRAGLSRSIFAQRFRERVGEMPIGYLAQWRIMLAKDRLADGRDTLRKIANDLGYGSENAFNTASRRVTGCSPRRYARARAGRASAA